jgi:hypothetical protein
MRERNILQTQPTSIPPNQDILGTYSQDMQLGPQSTVTLLLAGPQVGLNIDGALATRSRALEWLAPRAVHPGAPIELAEKSEKPVGATLVAVPERTKLYPRQVAEVNRSFDRIKEQFISHEETQTILEFVRAFVLSLGVDRNDAAKILQGLENIIRRNAFEEKPK